MSQDFKLKFDEMRNNEPGKQDDNLHASDGHVRKLAFQWLNGKRKTMNYAYLVSHEYNPDESTLTLFYTSDTILIKGSGLEHLDELLFYNIPKKIEVSDVRYSSLSSSSTVIKEILIEVKK